MALLTARSAIVVLLRGYKFAISPFFPPSCRYVPTCSEYAMEAVERYGAIRGLGLAFWRLLRCHPFVKGGFDPVPLKNSCNGALLDAPRQSTPERRTWRAAATQAHTH